MVGSTQRTENQVPLESEQTTRPWRRWLARRIASGTTTSMSTESATNLSALRVASRSWPYALFVPLLVFVYFAALQKFYLFDGDHAIQIIMARYFSWRSTDFYYWGQNRLGSLIPLLLVLPIKIFRWPALLCAVCIAVAFYVAALVLLVHQARSVAERLAAFVSFFVVPIGAYKFLLYTGHPYGPSMALSLAAFTLVFARGPVRPRMFIAGLSTSLALWVSEAAAAALVPLLWLAFERRKQLRIEILDWAVFFGAVSVLVPFMFYWRKQIGYEGHDAEYLKFADVEMLRLGLAKFLPQFTFMLKSEREGGPWFASWLASLLLAANLLALFLRRWLDERPQQGGTPLLSFLAAHNCVYFALIWIARHSYFGEGLIQRYWVPVIIYSLYVILVGATRAFERHRGHLALRAAAVGAALFVAVGSALMIPTNWPDRASFNSIEGHWADLELVRKRGATRVTGSYWRSLPLNVLSEFQILAIPNNFSRTARFKKQFSSKERRQHPERFVDFE
jgi:hypothetical protein